MSDYLTTEEAQAVLKISRATLYRLIEIGKLKAYKAGGRRTYFKRDDIEKLFTPVEDTNQADQPTKPEQLIAAVA